MLTLLVLMTTTATAADHAVALHDGQGQTVLDLGSRPDPCEAGAPREHIFAVDDRAYTLELSCEDDGPARATLVEYSYEGGPEPVLRVESAILETLPVTLPLPTAGAASKTVPRLVVIAPAAR